MKIYLDNCALGRLFDDQDQPRVRQEAAAIKTILGLVKSGVHRWISSQVLEFEVMANPDGGRRRGVLDQLSLATVTQTLNQVVRTRSIELRRRGFGDLDALHLAAAIHAGCDALLTTDDRSSDRRHGRSTFHQALCWILWTSSAGESRDDHLDGIAA